MTFTVMNLNKNDNNPLFLGESLGIQDYTNPRYPILNELALLQRSQYWTETEVDMSKDASQWKELTKETQDITVLNLSWQTQADSIVGRAPFSVLLPVISNPEYEGMMVQWGFFENLHSRAYSNIIQTVFPNPDEVLEQIKENAKAFQRLKPLVNLFDELHHMNMVKDMGLPFYNERDHKKLILKTLYAVYALESMQFYCSFACTFALAEQGILQGIASNLKLIAKDEALHTRMSLEVLKIEKAKPENTSLLEEIYPEVIEIMKEVMNAEREWGKYIFSEGRAVIGLNAVLMDEYLLYIANKAFQAVGLEVDFKAPDKNPIPWIDTWLEPDKVQVAPQEIQITNYRVGSSNGSLEGFDFDF